MRAPIRLSLSHRRCLRGQSIAVRRVVCDHVFCYVLAGGGEHREHDEVRRNGAVRRARNPKLVAMLPLHSNQPSQRRRAGILEGLDHRRTYRFLRSVDVSSLIFDDVISISAFASIVR